MGLKLNNAENVEHLCNIRLTKENFPIAFSEKVNELYEDAQGSVSREECETLVENMTFELEIYYHKGYGLFAVESDAIEMGADIFSPYNGEEYEGDDD